LLGIALLTSKVHIGDNIMTITMHKLFNAVFHTALFLLSLTFISMAFADVSSAVDNAEQHTKDAIDKTERVSSDSWITTKIKSSLLADSITKGFKIHVDTLHHIVTLSGHVDSQATIDHAVDIAKQVKGVESVNADNLVIGG
jgi:osmotically-inducible protein OsmY